MTWAVAKFFLKPYFLKFLIKNRTFRTGCIKSCSYEAATCRIDGKHGEINAILVLKAILRK